jgi:hypothetical protein
MQVLLIIPAAVNKHTPAGFAFAHVPDFFFQLDGVIEIIKINY